MKNKFIKHISLFFIVLCLLITSACGEGIPSNSGDEQGQTLISQEDNSVSTETATTLFDLSEIPAYSGYATVEVNGNIPYFTEEELALSNFENYSKLDSLGRCGVAFADICVNTLPAEERGDISSVYPSGWHTVYYDDLIENGNLYNRCHLIAFCLAGENDNEKNLITGTRYMNIEGMLPIETKVVQYVEQTRNHVLYRVTPVFENDNLVATGVLMEGYSVQDCGNTICFNIFAYNVQPGIIIDYSTGESSRDPDYVISQETDNPENNETSEPTPTATPSADDEKVKTYVLNTNTMRFHETYCDSVQDIKDKNKEYYTGTREELIAKGYKPCGRCGG